MPSKINISLRITGAEGGFHLLDSLVTTADLCDEICAEARTDGLITLSMSGMGSESIPFCSNNAARAAQLFAERFKISGAHIFVKKGIPIGAGLGGSSADAAGALLALSRLFDVSDFAAVEEIADAVGSDTRYMLRGGWARLTGRGNIIERIASPLSLYFLLIVPPCGVSAGECYRLYDRMSESEGFKFINDGGEASVKAAAEGDIRALGKSVYNALLYPAARVCPEVEEALGQAAALSPFCGMTGSGSAVFAAFASREECFAALNKYKGKFSAYTAKTCLPRIICGD